jgi:hypothetical protein
MLANENDNNWAGWFDKNEQQTLGGFTQVASGGSGGVLEGTIDLSQLYPSSGSMIATADIPTTIYVAAAEYATANGGALVAATQVPPTTNNDGNLDATELNSFPLASSSVADWSMY